MEQGHIFHPSRSFYPIWLSLKELCHQDGARSCFPSFRKLLSFFVKFERTLPQDQGQRFPTFRQILSHLLVYTRALPFHRDGARPHFPAFKKLLSYLVKFERALPLGWSKVTFSSRV